MPSKLTDCVGCLKPLLPGEKAVAVRLTTPATINGWTLRKNMVAIVHAACLGEAIL